MIKITLGLVTYNQSTFKYLEHFFSSLKVSLSLALEKWPNLDFKIAVFDNSDSNYQDNYNYLKEEDRVVKIFRSEVNLGFAKAYNQLIQWSLEQEDQFFLMLNPDILVDKDFLREIIEVILKESEVAVLAPKIYYWDFVNKAKTRIIDSCGLGLSRAHYFFDRGQGKLDQLDYRDQEEIFGFTGAGALINLERIKKIAYNEKEFFDEMMFMYKEDIDLSYRLQIAGEKIVFVPKAILYHDRSLGKSKWRQLFKLKNRNQSRQQSFLNQLIILYKIRKLPFSWKTRVFSGGRCLLLIIYAFIFARQALKEFRQIRRDIRIHVGDVKRIERFMV
ncbi:MAG: glycosyltransferase [Patescibacteria group bacterium]|jgi:GT2 family glycosyltransferase